MTETRATETLIVGAGHAGVALAAALHKVSSPDTVRILGDEPELPYERPALSKRLLYGQPTPDPVRLRSAAYWERSPVRLSLGQRVVAVDPDRRVVHTNSGEAFAYRRLVWAAGGHAARLGLAGETLAGVHTLRRLADLTALKADLTSARAVVIVGGGYLGLEAAAGLRRLGLGVAVVEAAPRLLARVTGEVVSDYFRAIHEAQGVEIRLGAGVDAIVGGKGRVEAVRLSDATVLPAEVVIMSVGMRPAVEPLLEAGVDGDPAGIPVDAQCRTSLPDVFAVGDCSRQINPYAPQPATAARIESVHNAGQQAATVSRSMTSRAPLDPPPPRFWSTQYGDELRTVGLPGPADEQILRGHPERADFSVLYLRDGRLAAVDAINRPRDFARAQALIAAGWQPPSGRVLADSEADLPHV